MDAALGELRAGGFDVRDKDVARLSPLGHGHLNVLGRYAFTLPEFVARDDSETTGPAALAREADTPRPTLR